MSITTAFLTFIAAVAVADVAAHRPPSPGLALAVAWFFWCRHLGPTGWRRLTAAALALSMLIAALALWQAIYIGGRVWGPFNSPNYLGTYAVLHFFLVAVVGKSHSVVPLGAGFSGGDEIQTAEPKSDWTGLRPIFLSANLLSLGFSQSRGALIALAAGLLTIAVLRQKLLIVIAPAALAVLAAFLIRPGNAEARLEIWWVGLQVARQHPLLGWGEAGIGMPGLGGFYNIPLDVLVEAGLLGLLAGAWLIASAAKVAFKEDSPCLAAVLIAWMAQGLFLFSIPATSIPLIAVLARLSVRGRRGRQDVKNVPGLIDGHEILYPVRRGLECARAEELDFTKLSRREAHPVEDVLVDLTDDAARIDRAGDRRREADRERRAHDKPGSKTLRP